MYGREESFMDIQLTYHSKMNCSFSDVDTVIKQARHNNLLIGITGILIVYLDNFIQILEGDRTKVNQLYHKIYNDTRHEACELISVSEIDARRFDKWSMNFVDIANLMNMKALNTLLTKIENGDINSQLVADLSTICLYNEDIM